MEVAYVVARAAAKPGMMRFGRIVILGILLAPSPGEGQLAPVRGVALDPVSGAPLPGVIVTLVPQSETGPADAVLTDAAGRFLLEGEVGAAYRLLAERVGLTSVRTAAFRLPSQREFRLEVPVQAVAIEGISVRPPVRACDIDRDEALTVQRWWEEIHKALQGAALVQATDLDSFRFERFQREWSRDLRHLRAEQILPVDASDARPFLAQDAATLATRGYVRGTPGERTYFAPDVAVLMSQGFLRDHCFRLEPDPASASHVRISVEPVVSTDIVDIRGSMRVDTLTHELQSFEFEYVNLPDDIPSGSSAGGHLTFTYLASGGWIVSEWMIRMPMVDARVWPRTVLAYVDEGGQVTGVDSGSGFASLTVADAPVRGMVYDSLNGRPLEAARVSVLGSRISGVTGPEGHFALDGVPTGPQSITVHHRDLTRLGIPSPVARLDVGRSGTDSVMLSVPGFNAVSRLLCRSGQGDPPAAILTGSVRASGSDREIDDAEVRAAWREPSVTGGSVRSRYEIGRTGADGRYMLCNLPSDTELTMSVRSGETWLAGGAVRLLAERVVARDLRPEDPVGIEVQGRVTDGVTGSGLSSARVLAVSEDGEGVVTADTDLSGTFKLVVPSSGRFVIVARAEGYAPASTDTLRLESGDLYDVSFEVTPTPAAHLVRGTVLDGLTGSPLDSTSVYLLNAAGAVLATSMSDSVGSYAFTVAGRTTYAVLAQRAGYRESEVAGRRDSESSSVVTLDVILQPEAIELGELTVSVRNERVVDWLTLAMGSNPAQYFGFRILQGARLQEAMARAEHDPTETLRWLFVPVWHRGPCVSVNVVRRPLIVGRQGLRVSPFTPGAAPLGTDQVEDRVEAVRAAESEPDCGRLFVDGRLIPNEQIQDVDMSNVAVITTLPGEVRMFTLGFDWNFRE